MNLGGFDAYFNRVVNQALGGAFGASPITNQVLPGPVSYLAAALGNDLNRAGMPQLGALVPQPTTNSLWGGFNLPGGYDPLPPFLRAQPIYGAPMVMYDPFGGMNMQGGLNQGLSFWA